MVKAGDIIRYGKSVEYVFDLGGGRLGMNACNESWIARGLSCYGDECYVLTGEDLMDAEVIGHHGSGSVVDARRWYESRK